MSNWKGGGYIFKIIFNHCKNHIPAVLLLNLTCSKCGTDATRAYVNLRLCVQVYSSLPVCMAEQMRLGVRAQGWWSCLSRLRNTPAYVGQNMLSFPILAEVYLAVFWSDETVLLCFPTPRPLKTSQIHPKCLPFLGTPFV